MCEYVKDEICHQEDMRKIFVGNIHLETTDDELKAFMEENSGDTVENAVVIRPKNGKTPKYYMGFCTFSDSDTPDELFLKRDSLEIRGVKLDIKRAVPKNDYTPGAKEKVKKLFIANLPKDGNSFKVEDLQSYFEQRHNPRYGTIEKIQLIKEKGANGEILEEKNKGFGFIFVSCEDFADKLSIQHRNFQFMDRKIDLKKNATGGDDGGFGGRRGGQQGGGGGGGRGRGGNHGNLQAKDGDWYCVCGNMNFARRTECNSCHEARAKCEQGAGGWGGDQGGWGQGWGSGYEYDQGYDNYYGGAGGYGGGYAAGGYGEHHHHGQQQQRGRGRGRGRGASWQ